MDASEIRYRLTQALEALRKSDKASARAHIRDVLAEHADNARAWQLAYLASDTSKQRLYCIERWLDLEPDSERARAAYAEEGDVLPRVAAPAVETTSAPPPQKLKVSDILFAPFALLLQLPSIVWLALLVIAGISLGAVYTRANTDFYGLAAPDFGSFSLVADCRESPSGDPCWQVVFERGRDSVFSGTVRHVSPIRLASFPMLTHDVLVTSGDFADPSLVTVNVRNHHFYWRSQFPERPDGAINLLHTAPADDTLYRQLLELRSGDTVVITGREILTISRYGEDGDFQGKWQDSGCNTLVVTSVELQTEAQ